MKNQPNLFLIGGMRCGSTTMHNLLAQHPEIYMSPIKEPVYYRAEYFRRKVARGDISEKTKNLLSKAENNGKYRSTKTYYSLFDNVKEETLIGESSHYFYRPAIGEAIFEDAPQARIIILVRDPIKRFYSEYSYYVKTDDSSGSFNDYVKEHLAIAAEEVEDVNESRLNKGLYADKIVEWQKIFGKEHVKVMQQEELVANIQVKSNEVFKWLGLNEHAVVTIQTQRTGEIKHKGTFNLITQSTLLRKVAKTLAKNKLARMKIRAAIEQVFIKKRPAVLSAALRQKMVKYYAEDQKKLKAYLGFNYPGYH
jgi:hypothetical protein